MAITFWVTHYSPNYYFVIYIVIADSGAGTNLKVGTPIRRKAPEKIFGGHAHPRFVVLEVKSFW